MKTTLLFIGFLLCTFLDAQIITVYYLEGDASLVLKSKSLPLVENAIVEEGSGVSLKANALVVLFMGEKAVVLNESMSYSHETILELLDKKERSIAGKYINELQEFSVQRDKSTGYKNVNVGKRMPHDGGEGIDFPGDSSIITTDAAVLVVDKEALPSYLYIYDNKKVIFRITAESSLKIFNTGLLEAGKWYGMAVTSEDNAPYASILNIKWASPEERERIKKEQSAFLAEIKDLPSEVQTQVKRLYDNDKRYDGTDY